MDGVRPAAVAGQFYPADAGELQRLVAQYLGAACASGPVPKALIAPHAGYVYSGAVAASAYALLAPVRDCVRRVVLLGPAHRVPLRGLALAAVASFATPLGRVPVDAAAVAALEDLAQVQICDEAHVREHCLEVHLPFLQETLRDFAIVPLVAGDVAVEDVAEVLEVLWGGDETLIVVSSDLSHFRDYETAQRLDRATSQAIEALKDGDLERGQACGYLPICGLLQVARRCSLRAAVVDRRNSGDTAGPRDQVVGYGAYVFSPVE